MEIAFVIETGCRFAHARLDGPQDGAPSASAGYRRPLPLEPADEEHRQRPVADQHAGGAERAPEHAAATLRRPGVLGPARQGGRAGRPLRANGTSGGLRRVGLRK